MSGIEIVGLVAAGVGFVQLLIKLGEKIYQQAQELENAKNLVSNMSYFVNKSSQEQLKLLVSLAKGIMNDPHVEDAIKDMLDRTFVDIQITMNLALGQAESTVATSQRHRDYFIYKRNRHSLDSSVSTLKALLSDFDNTVSLQRREQHGHAATFLSKAAFQTAASPAVEIVEDVSLRNGSLADNLRRRFKDQNSFILERREYDMYTKEELEENVKDLSKILVSRPRSKGILDLVGYNESGSERCFNLIFAIPRAFDFKATLHQEIETQAAISLEMRVEICKQLAEAVLHVHQLKLVHKNINPFNIAVMKPRNDGGTLQNVADTNIFLLNWRYVRRASDATNRSGESKWWKGIYCHPDRQMELAQEDYNMGHDIYSLGVSILEVLLWKTLVQTSAGIPTIATVFKDRAKSIGIFDSNQALFANRGLKSDTEIYTADPSAVRRVLIDLARTELPACAGTTLSRLVVSCLCCLEGGFPNMTFDAMNDATTGMNFIVAIKSVLSRISV